MAYNNANLTSGLNASFPITFEVTPYGFQYDAGSDDLSDVFGSDPMTGHHYFYGEKSFRVGDLIEVTANDGKSWTIVSDTAQLSSDVIVKSFNPNF